MKTTTRVALALPILLLTGACSVGRSSDTSAGSSADAASAGGSSSARSEVGQLAAPRKPSSARAAGTPSSARAARTVAPLDRSVISTGQVELRAEKLADARAEVFRLVVAWRGEVADEETVSDARGRPTETTMTLRVPTARFDEAMQALARIGEVEQQSRTSEDVTTQVIDNDARVRAAERSIRSIENLLSRATRLGDVIRIESDLARRQADLDSLKQQQAWLADQTSLSTIHLHVTRPRHAAPPAEARGFLGGLSNGWDALGATTVVVLTALGSVLPFLVLLGLVGVPLAWVVRRRRPLAAQEPPPAQA
jgi:hypothetical protein